MIKAWSHSRVVVFEQCKRHAKLKFVDRVPEPPRPLPPGKSEHANDRGTRIHEAAELFVKDNVELALELHSFSNEFFELRRLFREGKVSLEGEWAVDKDWKSVNWKSSDVWARIKLDALVHISDTHAVVIDYKTGKRWGNEIKHAEQMQLYQLASFLRYPKLQNIDVELWYTDLDELVKMSFTRAQGLRFMTGFTKRGEAMTSATEFPPNPNIFSCRYCPYGPAGTGHCEVGAQKA